jgi:hypothetical protein
MTMIEDYRKNKGGDDDDDEEDDDKKALGLGGTNPLAEEEKIVEDDAGDD